MELEKRERRDDAKAQRLDVDLGLCLVRHDLLVDADPVAYLCVPSDQKHKRILQISVVFQEYRLGVALLNHFLRDGAVREAHVRYPVDVDVLLDGVFEQHFGVENVAGLACAVAPSTGFLQPPTRAEREWRC